MLSQRTNDIAPFHVMEIMAAAQRLEREGRSIIHLEVGEPDFPTAEPILASATRFLGLGHVHYTAALGLETLREAIADDYLRRYGVFVSPSRIIVTAGASGALLLALGLLVNPGDEWLLPVPGYPCNTNFLRFVEGIPRPLAVSPDTRFQPNADLVDAAWSSRTRGLICASPSNPTGTMISAFELEEVWNVIRMKGGNLIVDEIYQGLSYGLDSSTALSISDEIFVINSFSKYYGMTGWRLGWMVVPEKYTRGVEKLAQNLFICPPTVAQHAALAAFKPETLTILESRRQEFAKRRSVLLAGLRQLGFQIPVEPQGAFYIYANCSRFTPDSFQFAHELLNEAGVAVTPGLDFGGDDARKYLRLAYTCDIPKIDAALSRIRDFLAGRAECA